MSKQQILCIHGADTFHSYEEYIKFLQTFQIDFDGLFKRGWKDSLQGALGEQYQVIKPSMPNKYFAHYNEWKIWFEKYFPFLNDNLILIGHSMGGIFLAKYLSENVFPKTIKATFLVAAPFDDEDAEDTVGDFALPTSLEKFKDQGGKIFLYQSKDDPVVPYADFLKYKKVLPQITERVFEDRDHFTQEELPEIIEDIRALS